MIIGPWYFDNVFTISLYFLKNILVLFSFLFKTAEGKPKRKITVILNVLLSWCYSIWKSASLMANLQMLLVWLRAKGQEQDNDERHLCQHFVRNHWGSNKSIWNRNLIVCNKIMQKLLHKKINGNDHGRFDRKGLLLSVSYTHLTLPTKDGV